MLVHWIWLATRPNISDRIKRDVLDYFSDAEDVFYADENALARCPDITEQAVGALMDKKLDDAWQIIDTCKRMAIHILTYCDAAYPSRLKNIADSPLVLYYRGRLPDFDAQPFIGVVGTRKASAYGLSSARKLGYQIACCGGAVVSGAAEGIDAAAMSGALTGNGTVVGVLGCGVDIVYPACNRALFTDTQRYGCLISEFAPGTKPYAWNFPKRNRIISGISHGVLVVEAPKKSGSLITAQQALEQGRDVFVVPGNIDSGVCEGSNQLLREGGMVATSGWDIVGEYAAMYPGKLRTSDQPLPVSIMPEVAEQSQLKVAQPKQCVEKTEKTTTNGDKKSVDKPNKPPYSDVEKKLPPLNEQEQRIVNELKQGERLTDEVIAATGIAAGQMLGVLTLLEIKGVIRRLPGNRIALK